MNKLDTEDLKSEKSLGSEDKMGLLGQGRGYFGIKKKTNKWIRLLIIWITFGFLGVYLIKINQFWAGIISFACGLMFTAFNNFLRD